MAGGGCSTANAGTSQPSLQSQVRQDGLPWPRPTAEDKGSETYGHGEGNPTLLGAARAADLPWPRPDASGANSGESLETWEARREVVRARGINGNGMGTPPGIAVRQEELVSWPRPAASDDAGPRDPDGKRGMLLRDLPRETSWPRPKASDAEKGSPNQATRTGPALPGAVCQEEIPWARPRASASEDRTTKRTPSQDARHGEYLGVQVQEEEPEATWARPRASAAHNRTTRRSPSAHRGDCLALQAIEHEPEGPWPRLTVSDGLGGHCPENKQPTKRQGSQPQKEVLGARLNPAWEEALLGWPIGLVSGLPWPEYGREVAERKRAARRNTNGSRHDSPPE